ncbi:MAG: hypothetical protein LUE16_02290 [Lachnospiraceae bacterium]|nr:hypothetical protein [Lachnospiraceae bacterium]
MKNGILAIQAFVRDGRIMFYAPAFRPAGRQVYIFLFVIHNVEEVILLGDRIVIMNNQTGKIEQILENKMRGSRSKQEMDSFVGEVIEILNEQQKNMSLVS